VVRYNSTVDSAWSGPCTLHVATPPAITLQPASARVRRGGSASFSIAASGTPPLTYAWIKGAADTVAGAAGPSITVLSAQKTDDMARYRCVVRNGAGAATSLPCTLRVVAAGFEAAPRNGIDSLTVLFTDSSTGGISAYSWNFGDGSPAGAAASPSHRYDSVGVYSVVLAVSAGGVADTARCADCINVKHAKPAVAFEADTFYAIDSLTVHFFDLTKGVVTAKRWDFGDGAADSSPADTVAHRYGDTGTYTVKLVESGPGGVDSLVKRDCIKVRSKGEYPVFVEARRLSTESVEISFYNYMSIITSRKSPMPPWADSMGLWFSRDSIPTSPSDSLIADYNIIAMQQSGREPYVDTVRVPFSAPADSVFYGFNTAAFWVNQPANAMKAGNGDIVLMRDTTPPKNPLTISGAYLAIDSFALYLDAVSSLDTHAIDSVGIWYGFKRANDFTDAQHTRWFSLSTIIASSSGNRFALTLRESRLNGDTVRLYCAALVIGRNRLKSAVVDSTFTAGRPHPENPIRLAAAARSPTSIFLTWKDKNTGKPITSVDNILIWRGRQPLPLTYSPPPEDFVALRPAVGDTAFLCGELNEKTRYYFGAQILSQGLWSSITEGASATDSTPQIEAAERPANTITMTNLYFDAGRNRIVVCWRVDSLDTAMEVGIAHSTVSFPRDSAAPPGQIIKTAALDSAAADVRKLEWDSTYYVTLWLRKKDGKWALPTDKSQRSLKLPADVSWQVVQYFTKYPDTVTVFSGRLKLAGADANPVPTTDTVRRCEASPASLKGFAAVSRCFAFVQHQAGAPFFIGVRYDADSIPSPYTAKDVRIYFEKEGEIFLQKTAFLDTARCMVWTLASDISAPIIALVDTAWPVVEVRSHPDEPVVSGRAFTDTFLISDNIANTRYWYRYAKGDGGEAAADSHETEASKAIVRASVKGQIVNQESGVRAALYVSDGPHTVAVDVSRQVIRDSTADAISAVANKWRPLKVAALLDSPSVKRMLKDLYVNGNWYYDNTEFRLFRWYAFAGNASDSVKWVEYSDTNDWMFSLEPCRLLWIKTRKNVALHGGKGRTSSLRKCYSVAAAPHTWTDIALPFGFSVCVGDIIDSTGGGGRGDSLQFYSWKADASGQYRCRPLYIADFAMKSASIANRSDSISKADGAFSVYNPLSSAVTISIPPIPPALSGYGPAKAKPGKRSGKDEGWAVRVAGRTQSGMEVSEVYCGYREGAPGARYYPLPMSLSRVGIGVCDGGKRLHGHGLARGSWDKENGVLFPLAFYNGSDRAETIAYAVENLESLPGSVKALIFDGETGLCEDASAPSAVQTAEGKTRYRHLAIGTDAYLKKVKQRMQGWRLGLASAFSTPFGHALKIRFTLPFAGVSGVRFAMVDLMGRTVWDDRIICGGASGMQEYVWRGSAAGRRPVVPGIYILRMVAWDEKRCVVGAFERKVSYLP
jgi:PKD repeat protein